MIAEEPDRGNGAPPTLLFALGMALLRGAVTAVTLAVFGVLLSAALFGARPGQLLQEALFDVFLAFFVAAPAAFAEAVARRRGWRHGVVGVAVGAVAFAGATAAFLQVQYASAVLSTGSFAAGIDALVTGAGWLTTYVDLVGLFAGIALVFGLISLGRVRDAPLEAQVRLTCLGAVAAGFLLAVTGVEGPALTMSGLMILIAGLVLPPLYQGCDSFERRFRARRA